MRRLAIWLLVRVVRASIVVERGANAVRDVCQGLQAGYAAASMMHELPAIREERPRLRLVIGGRR